MIISVSPGSVYESPVNPPFSTSCSALCRFGMGQADLYFQKKASETKICFSTFPPGEKRMRRSIVKQGGLNAQLQRFTRHGSSACGTHKNALSAYMSLAGPTRSLSWLAAIAGCLKSLTQQHRYSAPLQAKQYEHYFCVFELYFRGGRVSWTRK